MASKPYPQIVVVVVIVSLLGLACGCSSVPATVFGSRPEPRIIAIRNSTGRQLQSMSIGDDRDSNEPRRVGAMSPVMPGLTYPFTRAPKAPPLPDTLRVVYSFPGGREQSVAVDLREALAQAKGGTNEAIVFDVRPSGAVVAYVDHVEP